MTARRALASAAVGAALAAAAALPAPVGAFYGHGAQIVSADFDRREQGDDATSFAAISANGRYVAIQTRARNLFADDDPDPPDRYRAGGIFRFDLQTRKLVKVADGDLFEEEGGAFARRGASNPSISADGRYVAFATGQPLVAADVNDNVDVYVRDMTVPEDAPTAFELISARDGGHQPASYAPPAFPSPTGNPGAEVSRGVAISADGRRVAFRTDARSDLPAFDDLDAAAGQVYVRDRVALGTELVTRTSTTGAPAGGAVGAALSADGTTVAWTGANAGAQTRLLGGESASAGALYFLWRRISDGPQAPTRRITGASDPDDPACPPSAVTNFNQTSMGPCYGPLTEQEAVRAAIGAQLPALSADGRTVAFLTGAGPRPNPATGPGLDLYATDMTPGRSRKATTFELTRETVGNQPDSGPPVSSIAISSDGRYVAATSVRTRFLLPALRMLDSPRPVPGPRELYLVDLAQRTLQRVTRSHSGGDIDADVQNGVSLSADGSRIAFTSFASNLFFGDANQRADAFVAARQPLPPPAPPPAAPGAGLPAGSVEVDDDPGPGPRVTARARAAGRGAVAVTVTVPAAGGIRATARARAGKPRRLRAVATASARARTRGRVRLTLRLVRRYRAELRRRKAIPVRVQVAYVASRGGRRLSTTVRATVRQRAIKRR